MTENTTKTNSIWSFLTDEGKSLLAGLEGFLSNVSAEVVSTVLPVATQTGVAELTAIATGDTKDTGHILAAGVKNAEAAAIQVGVTATAEELSVIGGATHAPAAQ